MEAEQIEDLLAEQKRTAKYIKNFIANTTKSQAAATLSVFDLEARLELLRSYYKGLNDRDSILQRVAAKISERTYMKEETFLMACNDFLNAQAWINERLRALNPPPMPNLSLQQSSAAPAGAVAPYSMQASLEKIKLPRFGGRQSDWESFKEKFESMILSDSNMPPIMKFQHLLNCVEGEAAEKLRGIQLVGANFNSAWGALCRRYDNEYLRFSVQMLALMRMPPANQESVRHINTLLNTVNESINVFTTISCPVQHWDHIFIFFIETKLAPSTKLDWSKEVERLQVQGFPSYEQMKKFLEGRICTLDRADVNGAYEETPRYSCPKPEAGNDNRGKKGTSKSSKTGVHLVQQPRDKKQPLPKCTFCRGAHFIGFCKPFAEASRSQRKDHVTKGNLCFNCLNAGHAAESCASKGRCYVCGAKHHTKLHVDSGAGAASSSVLPCKSESETTAAHAVIDTVNQLATSVGKNVLLSTACVVLESGGHAVTARALLDSGAEESFVSEQIVQALSLRQRPVAVAVSGVGGSTTAVAKSRVTLTLKSQQSPNFNYNFSALVLKRLTSLIPRTNVAKDDWQHLKGLQLADNHFGTPGRIDCILNSEVYAAAILSGVQKGPPGTPTALQSVFGWVVLGAAGSASSGDETPIAALHATVDPELSRAITRFWELEEVPSTARLSPQEEACLEHFKTTHTRNHEGRYVVRLPFLQPPLLFESRNTAAACLHRLERRFAKQPELASAYVRFMTEYHDLQHMEVVTDPQVNLKNTYYLPHHPVIKKDGSGKIRVVFNASQKDPYGVTLNSFMHTGPKLQEDILTILIRWSFFKYVFSCDVVKMFRQFLVHSEDADWQRILWRKHSDDSIVEFRLVTVTYGTASAPFLANACMLQLADDEGSMFPKGAEVLRKSRYADDSFAGGDTIEEAKDTRDQLVSILKAAGMTVGKWSANDPGLIEVAADEPKVMFSQEETVSTLGLRWAPFEDVFCFKICPSNSANVITKRTMLSEIARLFDPIGWLSPVVVQAKLMLQNLWLRGADWDDPAPAELKRNWLIFSAQLVDVESIKIPRWFGTVSSSNWEIHGFCDASERAYAAALYVVHDRDNNRVSKLMAAKSKVAPIKVVSVPKLELCGAALLARLLSTVLAKLDNHPSQIHCWSDSKVVLAWLQGHPSRWQAFVGNRVSEVISLVPTAVWRHVRSADNPADLASRGVPAAVLRDSTLWWHGPAWLLRHESEWPISGEGELVTDLEARKLRSCYTSIAAELEDWSSWISKFSSIDKIIRVLSYVARWRFNSRLSKLARRNSWLSAAELHQGFVYLLRVVQRSVFAEEYVVLHSRENVPKGSAMFRLLPFVDSEGLIRVGGRLQNSFLAEGEKHPIILPSNCHVTKLLVEKAHRITLHGGPTLVQSHLSRSFWILRGRNFIRGIVRRCIKCTRFHAAALEQQMGPLPAVRTRPARPFSFTGVDYAGPFMLRASAGRGQKSFKGYVAVFVCLVVKAVHLEVVSDLTTSAFLAAFRRFVSRRGLCKVMYSDNGTTFQGADAELKRAFHATTALTQEIAAAVARDGVEWTFIPPRAPNFGGLWEANVKSFKRHLKPIIGESRLSFEEFTTVLVQIEACLNSRPLSALSSSGEDLCPLTPGHFLIGAPLISAPEPFENTNEITTACSRWHLLSQMRNHFWKRWRSEYLAQMQQRSKWLHPNRTLEVGDLVLFKDELLPPTKWPIARIVKLHPGGDGLSRVATVQTASSTFRRPVNKLILLPVNEEASAHFIQLSPTMAGGAAS